jgi:hypothetical protein
MCLDHYQVLLLGVQSYIDDDSQPYFERIRRIIELSRGISISAVSFISDYLRERHDEGNVMMRGRLKKYDKKFYAEVLGPLLQEAREKGECRFAASPEVLAVFIYQIDQGVSEEINQVFLEEYGKEAEDHIEEILKAGIYAFSCLLNASPERVSRLFGAEGAMHFYRDLLKAKGRT